MLDIFSQLFYWFVESKIFFSFSNLQIHISLVFNFAAFVITRNRPVELVNTLNSVFAQTLSPDLILIVDNGSSNILKDRLKQLYHEKIEYLNPGYNSGPAGASFLGMEYLFGLGYDWVLWIDDNDPPAFDNLIENLYKIIIDNDNENLGMVGAVGECFNPTLARILRFKDVDLSGYLHVDTISGNMFPFISKRVFDRGLLPLKKLFFGFEELDFCLLLKRNNFIIVISGDLHMQHRIKAGRLNLKSSVITKRNIDSLWREYYSVRNMSFILLFREKNLIGFFVHNFRCIIKSFFLFSCGFQYGKLSFYFIWRGLFDGLFGIMGSKILPTESCKNY